VKVLVEAEMRGIRAGTEAYAHQLHLAGHGVDAAEAVESLRRGVLAWCKGLLRLGELEPALKARRTRWEEDGDDMLSVEVLTEESGGER